MIKLDTRNIRTLKITIKELNNNSVENIKKCVTKSTHQIERKAKINLTKNTSVKTGHLRRSLNSNIKNTGGKTTGEVSTNVFYAYFVEGGTKAHIIKAKRKKALYWKGAKHPVKSVNHPGSKAKPYLIPAFDEECTNFEKEIRKAVEL